MDRWTGRPGRRPLETFPIHRRDPEQGGYDHWILWLGDGDVLVAGSELTIEPSGG